MNVTITPGENLWDALYKRNVILERPCGGKGTCGRCLVEVMGVGQVRCCQFTRPGNYEVVVPEERQFDTVFVAENKKARTFSDVHSSQAAKQAVIAVDIGTTTVAILAEYGGRQVRRSFVNPQRQYGADVISRIEASNAGEGETLRSLLMEKLQKELAASWQELAASVQKSGQPLPNPDFHECQVVIGGNTTMLHILRGFSCEGLGQAPFVPVDLGLGSEHWKCGGQIFSVTYLPGISAYIGADIVSGIYGLGLTKKDEIVFLLDLGTNGEMAIGNARRLLCASAAAGPAFEGSELAVKIHAAGILKVLHEMQTRGVMDEYGLLEEPYFSEGYPVEQKAAEDPGAGMRGEPDPVEESESAIRITQDDIREIQMAKGAIRAGIEILLKEYGVTAAQVDRVCLAGGMGYYLAPEDAVAIGLIPKEFAGKTQAVGNSCLMGALQYLHDQEVAGGDKDSQPKCMMVSIAESAEEIILADHRDFAELYIEMMNFCYSSYAES